MSVKIIYSKKKGSILSSNVVLFVNDKFNTNNVSKYLSDKEYAYINELLKTSDLKKNIFVYEVNSKRKIILISIKVNLKNSDIENLGAEFYGRVYQDKNSEYFINSDSVSSKNHDFLSYFLHGFKLKSYKFIKYKTKKETNNISVNLVGNKNFPSVSKQLKFKALEEGTFFARDLVSEPGNVLHPDEYAKRINSLRKDGLKVNIYDKKKFCSILKSIKFRLFVLLDI